MADIFNLTANARSPMRQGAMRTLRGQGFVPAIIYGDGKDPLSITIEEKPTIKLYNTGKFLSTLVHLELEGTEGERVIARDVQLHPITDKILHIDFLRLGKGARINVEVPVQFINEEESPGLKGGCVMNIVRHTIELSCPAGAIPDRIEIDLTGLEVGDSIHISGITLPEGTTPTIADRDFTIVTIVAPAAVISEEAAEDEEEVEGEEGAEGTEASTEAEGDAKPEDKDGKGDKGDKGEDS